MCIIVEDPNAPDIFHTCEREALLRFGVQEQAGAHLLHLARGQGCKAGMIFVDFARRARLHVNGRLRAAPADQLPG